MKAWQCIAASVVVLGCGGSVNSDLYGSGGSGASAGSAGAGGSGASGGSAGASGSGGTGGTSGSAGTAGAAGSGGAPVCCGSDYDCPQYLGNGDGDVPLTQQCVYGVCKGFPEDGQCWDDGDCPTGSCLDASVCPCGYECIVEDHPGYCESPQPAPLCCKADMDCGDIAYTPCVNGVCKVTVPGACWKSEECLDGKTCVGASVCPCGALCATADVPGKCL